jgi:hypothetical protein
LEAPAFGARTELMEEPMWRHTRFVAPVLALAFLAACDAATSTDPSDEAVEFVSEEALMAAATAEIGAAGDHAGLATSLPGFGGFWFDRRCNLNVVLTDAGNPDLTIEALTPLLRRKLELEPRCPDDATIILHRGDYTWVELSRWLPSWEPPASGVWRESA